VKHVRKPLLKASSDEKSAENERDKKVTEDDQEEKAPEKEKEIKKDYKRTDRTGKIYHIKLFELTDIGCRRPLAGMVRLKDSSPDQS
jgi:hypothetical protein